MKIEIHVSEDRRTFSLSVDGGDSVPLENFILLTKEGEMTRNLVFGTSESIGRLIYGFYVNAVRFEENAMRDVLELVSEDIHDIRGRRITSSEETIRRLM